MYGAVQTADKSTHPQAFLLQLSEASPLLEVRMTSQAGQPFITGERG